MLISKALKEEMLSESINNTIAANRASINDLTLRDFLGSVSFRELPESKWEKYDVEYGANIGIYKFRKHAFSELKEFIVIMEFGPGPIYLNIWEKEEFSNEVKKLFTFCLEASELHAGSSYNEVNDKIR